MLSRFGGRYANISMHPRRQNNIDRINVIDGVVDTDMVTVMEYVKERYDYDW